MIDDSVYERMVSRYEAKLAHVTNELEVVRRQASLLESELQIFKRRCYPTAADVERNGITKAKTEVWSARVGGVQDGPDWRFAGMRFVWLRSAEDELTIADLIEFAADALVLDQWAVLAEMAAIEVPVEQRAAG